MQQVTRSEYQAKVDSINTACNLRIEESKVFYEKLRSVHDDAEWIKYAELWLSTQLSLINNMREEEIYYFGKRVEIVE